MKLVKLEIYKIGIICLIKNILLAREWDLGDFDPELHGFVNPLWKRLKVMRGYCDS